jgi:hypothetical protein
MVQRQDDAIEVLRMVWAADDTDRTELDEACGTQKPCKNMKHVGFGGLAEPGSDLRSAWRERLEREGKLDPSGGTIRDLILGRPPSARP